MGQKYRVPEKTGLVKGKIDPTATCGPWLGGIFLTQSPSDDFKRRNVTQATLSEQWETPKPGWSQRGVAVNLPGPFGEGGENGPGWSSGCLVSDCFLFFLKD